MLQKSQLAKKLSRLSICSISKYESFPPKYIFFNFSFYVFSTKMLLITSQIEFKNNKRSPERKLPFFQPNCKKSQIE